MKGSTIKRLKRYFLLSTAVPFLLIVVITTSIIQVNDRADISTVVEGYLRSISENISGYFKDLRQVAILPYFSQEIMDNIKLIASGVTSYNLRLDLESQMNSLLSSVRYTTNDFYSAILVKDNTVLYSSHTGLDVSPVSGYPFENTAWYKEAFNSDETFIFLPPHTVDYYLPQDREERISLLTTIRNLNTRQPYAVLKIDILPSFFDKYLSSVEFHLPSCVYITDSGKRLIYSTGKDRKMLERLDAVTSKEGLIERNLFSADTYSTAIPNSAYTLNIAIDTKASLYKSLKIYASSIALYLTAVAAAFFLFNRYSSRITEPVEELRRVLGELSRGNFSSRYEEKENWDLEELGAITNTMAGDLEKLINQNYVAELEKKDAENRALLSQIQPHFLFNTLNSIISLIYDGRVDEGVECIYSLSNLMHYVLKTENTVTLEDEADFLRDYLLLQKTRFNDRLDWTIDIPPSLSSLTIPRLFLQPFVENSVIHGTEPAGKMCHVRISGRKEGDSLILSVDDDGIGFDTAKTDIYSSIGISNSVHRLKLIHEKSSVTISSTPGNGCSVTIRIEEKTDEYTLCR